MKVAFLGLGRMGAPMASRVARSAHDLTVWNRSADRARPLAELGARVADSVGEAVAGADAVVIMVYGPEAVGEVLEPALAGATADALLINTSTVGPAAARDFATATRKAGLRYVDAPVSGTTQPAAEGKLTVLVGGADGDVAAARPVLELWAPPEQILHVGEVGAGSALKLVVNLGLGIAAAGLGESLRLAGRLGVDTEVARRALGRGALGWTLERKRPMIESGDYSATTFSLGLLAKDLRLALDSAADPAGDGAQELPVTAATLAEAQAAVAAGLGEQDYAALIGHLAR